MKSKLKLCMNYECLHCLAAVVCVLYIVTFTHSNVIIMLYAVYSYIECCIPHTTSITSELIISFMLCLGNKQDYHHGNTRNSQPMLQKSCSEIVLLASWLLEYVCNKYIFIVLWYGQQLYIFTCVQVLHDLR